MIDSRFIGGEISIDGESAFDGSMFEDFGFDVFFTTIDGIRCLSEGLVLFVQFVISGLTFVVAFGGSFDGSAGFEGSVDVMVTSFKSVGFAPFIGHVMHISGNNTNITPVLPGGIGVSSVTSISTVRTAGGEILGGNSGLEGLVRGDTDSVGHGFDGSESPARSTVSLISNFEKRGTVGPFGSGIEFFG